MPDELFSLFGQAVSVIILYYIHLTILCELYDIRLTFAVVDLQIAHWISMFITFEKVLGSVPTAHVVPHS